jgi:hypothetical protein
LSRAVLAAAGVSAWESADNSASKSHRLARMLLAF